MGSNEKKDKAIEQQEVVDVKAVEIVEPAKKDGFRAKTGRFCKKHKKGLIAGAVAVVALALYGLARKDSDDYDTDEAIEMEPTSIEDQEENADE